MRTRLFALAAASLFVFALSGCIYMTPKDGQAQQPVQPAPAQPAAATPSPTQSSAGVGLSATATAIGTVVADAKGWILYRFNNDAANPSKTTCYNDCAKKWPPVPYSPNYELNGVDAKYVGKVQRTDGTYQLTIGGWPVYRYAADVKPGDTKGQGVGSTWYAVTPEGKKAAGAPPKSDY
jgi:predicted lipoprotein with Yx(FWY)xxD motif